MARSSIVQPFQGYGAGTGSMPPAQTAGMSDGRPETPVSVASTGEAADAANLSAAGSKGSGDEVAAAGGHGGVDASGTVGEEAEDDEVDSSKAEEAEGAQGGKISKVGQVLSDITTRRVIVLILLMLIVVPFLEGEADPLAHYRQGGLEALHRLPQDRNVSEAQFRDEVETYARFSGRIVQLSICPPVDDTSNGACAREWETTTIHQWLRELRFQPESTGVAPCDGRTGTDVNPINDWNPSFLELNDGQVESEYRDNELVAY